MNRRIAFVVVTAVIIASAIGAALAVQNAAPIVVVKPDHEPSERIRPVLLQGTRYVSTSDIARVFRATKYWRPELRKLSLRFGDHTIRFTVDAPIVVVDETARNLVRSPRLVQGQVYVPESVIGGLMEWGLVSNATWDEAIRVIRFRSPVHTVRQANLWVRGRVTEISASLLKSLSPRLVYATPGEIRLLFEGGTLDSTRFIAGGSVLSGVIQETPDGVEIRLVLAPGAQGYSMSVGSNRLRLAVTDDQDLVQQGIFSRLEPIAIGGPDGRLRTIILDPGHGGKDPGADLPGAGSEKDATLDFAKLLRAELQERTGARVILTRDADEDRSIQRRSEIANEWGADLFISIHLDDEGALRSGGVRVYSLSTTPMPGGADRLPLALGQEGGAEMQPWESAQLPAAGTSMAVGQTIADALARSYPQTPISFRTGRLSVLEPVACAAIVLECAPPPRGPQAMSLQGYSMRDIARIVAQSVQDLARGARA